MEAAQGKTSPFANGDVSKEQGNPVTSTGQSDSPPSPTPTSSSAKASGATSVQELTDQALRFLSSASNETIGACLVGLGATTYLILGRVGLVLIGVVGGVVLHATWEGGAGTSGDAEAKYVGKRRREIGTDVIHRILNWRSAGGMDKNVEDEMVKLNSSGLKERDLEYLDFRPETAGALRQLSDAVISNYVMWWYCPIIPEETKFPATCRTTLTSFILSISNNLARKRPADTFLNFVTNTSSVVVVFFNELSTAINASPLTHPAEATQAYIRLKPDSNLAHVMDRKQQRRKLHIVAEDILQSHLEQKTLSCPPARVFLREILASTILENTIETCSRPEWINEWIVNLLDEGEPELMKDIDAGLEVSTGSVDENMKSQVKETEVEAVTSSKSAEDQASDAQHRRVVSRGQEAFDEAMQHVAELNRMIEEEDQKRRKEADLPQKPLPIAMEPSSAIKDRLVPKTIEAGDTEPKHETSTANVMDDMSESTTQGIPTPTSSQSDHNTNNEGDPDRPTSDESQRSDQPTSIPESEPKVSRHFTSFDQIMPQNITALSSDVGSERQPLTFYKANMSIFDDSAPGDRSAMKSKPMAEYLIQVEPASTYHSGWMIARKYSDFETLHEVIYRISKVTGAGFDKIHPAKPAWKGSTKSQFRESLERYLNDAARCQSLAESEGMKRFLEKDQEGRAKSPSNGKGGMSFESFGKGMVNAIASGPKEVAGGGKAFIDGVTGVFGNKSAQKRPSTSNGSVNPFITGSSSPQNRSENIPTLSRMPRQSTDNFAKTVSNSGAESQESTTSLVETKRPITPECGSEAKGPRMLQQTWSTPTPDPLFMRQSVEVYPSALGDEIIQLPPPPSEIHDDYVATSPTTATSPNKSQEFPRRRRPESILSDVASTTAPSLSDCPLSPKAGDAPPQLPARPTTKKRTEYPPLNEQEATVAIELLFAVITELYTLSSAWSLRRTLLNAAKAFLLHPGNPQLESIRALIQQSVLDANTSDAGIASHLLKLRANSLPTEEELALWPKERTAEEKEDLRVKARKMLVERGMPIALTRVMGQAASGEAVGKVFDCLQDRDVARGLVFGLLLQGIRAVVQ